MKTITVFLLGWLALAPVGLHGAENAPPAPRSPAELKELGKRRFEIVGGEGQDKDSSAGARPAERRDEDSDSPH